ncbi:sigma-70 family RNA polymerase sigma factor [Porticoccus sp. W117]|uniref:RNA polymerase sigma factor n=1 Tax=Porticoccus sp. W117 TaxID=3054777 RepID=UPI00259496A3|nr:sigma-70 family RNA polymerase sigma factor [Porticoccus sp. W117]MDM3871877.1 sigma-70 family RNA polymerase sigma factor [Porticoccus sp. W117]
MRKQKAQVVKLPPPGMKTRPQVLEHLHTEHGPALKAFLAVRMGRGNSDIEDVFQDVFVRLSNMPDLNARLSTDQTRNRAFIFTIANNLALDLIRSKQVRARYQQRQTELDDNDIDRQETCPERSASAQQELDRLKNTLMKLKPEWRKALIMHRIMHNTYQEIASEMDVTIKQVEWFLKNAVSRLNKTSISRRK